MCSLGIDQISKIPGGLKTIDFTPSSWPLKLEKAQAIFFFFVFVVISEMPRDPIEFGPPCTSHTPEINQEVLDRSSSNLA